MKVSDILVNALKEVEEAGIQGDLRSVAFGKAVDLLSVGSVWHESSPAGTRVRMQEAAPLYAETPVAKIAAKLKLDVETVSQVFDASEGSLELIVGQGKFDKRASGGTKEIALALVAGRQGAGMEEWTHMGVIREAAEAYKRIDPPNFASTIKAMDDVFSIKGTGTKREVKLARPGWEKAADLVTRLGNGGEA